MIRFELNQAQLRGGQRLPLKLVDKALRATFRAVKLKRSAVLSIAFISEREMRVLNKKWRKRDCITDVLSFPLKETSIFFKEGERGVIGEIVISYEQAARQAIDAGHSTRNELIFLIVHGTLHVLGYDHERPKDKARMFSLQTKILRTLKIDAKV